MSVPAVADHTGWQSRRVRRLPANASAYAGAVGLAAAIAAAATTLGRAPTSGDLTTFALLLPLAAISPWFRVSVGRNHGFHTGPVFAVAAALVLPPLLVVALVVAMQPAQWLKDRAPWYIQTFNGSNYLLSTLGAAAAAEAVGAGSDQRFALGGAAAVLTFVLINHALLAVMLRLGRGHSFRASGLFSPDGLAADTGLAALGIAVGAFAQFNPWLLPALLAPLALAHRSLSTVALLHESE